MDFRIRLLQNVGMSACNIKENPTHLGWIGSVRNAHLQLNSHLVMRIRIVDNTSLDEFGVRKDNKIAVGVHQLCGAKPDRVHISYRARGQFDSVADSEWAVDENHE